MTYLPKRKVIRLKDHDYSQAGCYFISICIKKWNNILWSEFSFNTNNGRPALSKTGLLIDTELNKISSIYECVKIDNYVIMPNHIHMIIRLSAVDNEDGRPQAAPAISRIINQFKGSISKQLGYSIWQKLFIDCIMRDEDEYLIKWRYIDENPVRWTEDDYYA